VTTSYLVKVLEARSALESPNPETWYDRLEREESALEEALEDACRDDPALGFDPIDSRQVEVRRDEGEVLALISELLQHGKSLLGARRGAYRIIRAEASSQSRLGPKASRFVGVDDKQNRSVRIPFDNYNVAKTRVGRHGVLRYQRAAATAEAELVTIARPRCPFADRPLSVRQAFAGRPARSQSPAFSS
jgi:hypothetical protein